MTTGGGGTDCGKCTEYCCIKAGYGVETLHFITCTAMLLYISVRLCALSCQRRECVSVMKNNGGISISLTLRLGAIQMPKAYKLFQLRAHPQFLICCPVGQMFSLHGGKESTQRFQLSRVSKCEATWQRARPIPTSLLQVLLPSSEHIQAWEMAKALGWTIFCCSAKLMLKVESFVILVFLIPHM